ncbi:MAG: hypothetical protein MUC65_02080, partial [Pontiellaceae bacterium]|nr:hypothetical protein [Pontiellaceae bacterium]
FFSGLITGVVLSVAALFAYRKYKEIRSRIPFSIRVSMVTRPLPAYVVDARGDLLNREDQIAYLLRIQDCTDGVVSPILFKSEGAEKTVDVLEVNGPSIKVKPKAQLSDWTRIVTLPWERIRFSYKGNRTLTFSLAVAGAEVFGESVFVAEQKEAGFVEVKERMPDIYASIWYLLVGLRSKFNEYSDLIIERSAEFLVKESESWGGDEKAQIFESFRLIVEVENPTISWEEACASYSRIFKESADSDMRNDIMRLFFSLLIEENGMKVEARQALKVFYDLCVGIGMDMGVFTRLVDRFILNNDLSGVPSGCLLGLYVGMDLETAKTRLMEEYKKWNARITHSDVAVRGRAAYMLETISTARAELR